MIYGYQTIKELAKFKRSEVKCYKKRNAIVVGKSTRILFIQTQTSRTGDQSVMLQQNRRVNQLNCHSYGY